MALEGVRAMESTTVATLPPFRLPGMSNTLVLEERYR